jgi:tight adherence protein B
VLNPYLPALLAAAAYLVATADPAARLRPRGSPVRWEVVAAASSVLAGVPPPLAGVAVVAALTLPYARRRLATARAARAAEEAVPEACRAVAAELRAGAPPPVALARAANDAPEPLAGHLHRAAAAAQLGTGTVAWPPSLAPVAALWQVAADNGNGLADGLDRLAEALAADQRQRADVAAQLAGPRASAAVLAALPAFGLLLGAALGADPFRFLLGTPAGAACLVAGVALDAAGTLWVRRIATQAVT